MTNILIDISINIMYTYIPDTLRYVNIYTAWVSISSKDRLRRWLLSRPAAANGRKQRCNTNQFSPFIYCMYLNRYIYIFTICRFNLKTFAWEIGYIQIISNIIKTYDNYACEYQSWLFIVWLDDLWEYLLSKLVEILKFWMPQLVTCFHFCLNYTTPPLRGSKVTVLPSQTHWLGHGPARGRSQGIG